MKGDLNKQTNKILPAMQEMQGSIPGLGRSLKENGNLLQYLAWEIPWTEDPGGLQSVGSQSDLT